jgi:hypothetical protein
MGEKRKARRKIVSSKIANPQGSIYPWPPKILVREEEEDWATSICKDKKPTWDEQGRLIRVESDYMRLIFLHDSGKIILILRGINGTDKDGKFIWGEIVPKRYISQELYMLFVDYYRKQKK